MRGTEDAMKSEAAKPKTPLARRELLRVLGFGAGAAAVASAPLVEQARADGETPDEKRRARYQPDSPDVQAFYRVNRYPAAK
jgi:hypothetical protein